MKDFIHSAAAYEVIVRTVIGPLNSCCLVFVLSLYICNNNSDNHHHCYSFMLLCSYIQTTTMVAQRESCFDTNMHNASSNKCITEACRQANANEITRVCIFTVHSRYARIGTQHQHVTQLLVAVSPRVDVLFAMFNLVSAFVSLFKLLHTLYRMCYSWCAFRDAGVCFGAAVVFIM